MVGYLSRSKTNSAKGSFIVGGMVLVFAFMHDLPGWACWVPAPLACNVSRVAEMAVHRKRKAPSSVAVTTSPRPFGRSAAKPVNPLLCCPRRNECDDGQASEASAGLPAKGGGVLVLLQAMTMHNVKNWQHRFDMYRDPPSYWGRRANGA